MTVMRDVLFLKLSQLLVTIHYCTKDCSCQTRITLVGKKFNIVVPYLSSILLGKHTSYASHDFFTKHCQYLPISALKIVFGIHRTVFPI